MFVHSQLHTSHISIKEKEKERKRKKKERNEIMFWTTLYIEFLDSWELFSSFLLWGGVLRRVCMGFLVNEIQDNLNCRLDMFGNGCFDNGWPKSVCEHVVPFWPLHFPFQIAIRLKLKQMKVLLYENFRIREEKGRVEGGYASTSLIRVIFSPSFTRILWKVVLHRVLGFVWLFPFFSRCWGY